MRWRSTIVINTILAGMLLTVMSGAWAWDGDWTKARSGNTGLFEDPESSHGKSGHDPPQKFLTPSPRDFIDVDPEELVDYFEHHRKDYAPYAFARITSDIRYNNLTIPKGYYLVKPGDVNDGSPRVNLKTLSPPNLPIEKQNEVIATWSSPSGKATTGEASIQPINSTAQPTNTQTPASAPAPTVKQDEPVYRVFVLIKQGKVTAVVPIHSMQYYRPPRKEKIPKHPLAWLEIEDRHPVLKFYYKKRIYTTHFQ